MPSRYLLSPAAADLVRRLSSARGGVELEPRPPRLQARGAVRLPFALSLRADGSVGVWLPRYPATHGGTSIVRGLVLDYDADWDYITGRPGWDNDARTLWLPGPSSDGSLDILVGLAQVSSGFARWRVCLSSSATSDLDAGAPTAYLGCVTRSSGDYTLRPCHPGGTVQLGPVAGPISTGLRTDVVERSDHSLRLNLLGTTSTSASIVVEASDGLRTMSLATLKQLLASI